MTHRARAVLFGIAVGAASIVIDASRANAGICPTWGCTGNSATLGDGIVFDELNSNGQVRDPANDVRIISAEVLSPLGWRQVKLEVKGYHLGAVDLANPSTVYRGEQLSGMTFSIGHPDGRRYEVKVMKFCSEKEQVAYWEKLRDLYRKRFANTKAMVAEAPIEMAVLRKALLVGSKSPILERCPPLTFWMPPETPVPYFELKVRKTHTRDPATNSAKAGAAKLADEIAKAKAERKFWKRKNDDRRVECEFKEQLCNGEALRGDHLWAGVRESAIFYEGDHFDPASKTVTATAQTDGWFNLACAGAVPAKMHLLRHTKAGWDSTPAHTTSTDQRTAMLKMITADYCGDGKAFTGENTPLRYRDARNFWSYEKWDPAAPGDFQIEAVWGPQGALCLNEPRRLPRMPQTHPCKRPAVMRTEVEGFCNTPSRTYPSAPPWMSGTTVNQIPRCTPQWASEWTTKAAGYANSVYVISASDKAVTPGRYCDNE